MLGLGAPVGRRANSKDNSQSFDYEDPVTKASVTLYFTPAGGWSGLSARTNATTPQPTRGRLDRMAERIRRSIVSPNGGIGLLAWLILLAMLLPLRAHRRLIAELMLAVAVMYTVACLAIPTSGGRLLRQFVGNESLLWAIGMLATSPVIGWASSRLPALIYPHCAQCGYNLTGNVSGVCPECGTPVNEDHAAPDKPDNPDSTMADPSPPPLPQHR